MHCNPKWRTGECEKGYKWLWLWHSHAHIQFISNWWAFPNWWAFAWAYRVFIFIEIIMPLHFDLSYNLRTEIRNAFPSLFSIPPKLLTIFMLWFSWLALIASPARSCVLCSKSQLTFSSQQPEWLNSFINGLKLHPILLYEPIGLMLSLLVRLVDSAMKDGSEQNLGVLQQFQLNIFSNNFYCFSEPFERGWQWTTNISVFNCVHANFEIGTKILALRAAAVWSLPYNVWNKCASAHKFIYRHAHRTHGECTIFSI